MNNIFNRIIGFYTLDELTSIVCVLNNIIKKYKEGIDTTQLNSYNDLIKYTNLEIKRNDTNLTILMAYFINILFNDNNPEKVTEKFNKYIERFIYNINNNTCDIIDKFNIIKYVLMEYSKTICLEE